MLAELLFFVNQDGTTSVWKINKSWAGYFILYYFVYCFHELFVFYRFIFWRITEYSVFSIICSKNRCVYIFVSIRWYLLVVQTLRRKPMSNICVRVRNKSKITFFPSSQLLYYVWGVLVHIEISYSVFNYKLRLACK